MDIRAYISSGILELYCAGSLTERENREVEAYAKKYPEIQTEIDAIQDALDQYAKTHSRIPDASLKAKIMSRIDEDLPGPSSNNSSNKSLVKTILGLGLAVASVLAFVFYNKYNDANDYIDQIKTDLTKAKSENESFTQQLNGCHDQMLFLIHKDTKIIPLSGLPIAPSSKVIVYWNSTNQNTYVNVADLPVPPQDKQYQLWALVGGKPVDAGVFDNEKHTLQTMKLITSAEAFAVTLEKKGGSPSPTLDQMYVMGKI